MKILYKFASRSRPEKFVNGILNIENKSTRDDYFILCSLDTDDPTSQDMPSTDYRGVVYGESKNKVDAINRDIWVVKDWDILVNFSDDMEFVVDGFDQIIVDDMMKYFPDTDGVLHYPDGNIGDRLMTMSIIGRKYYERDGYIYNPDYISLWCDNEAQEVAKLRGKYQYIDKVLFNHNHPAFGKCATDEQYIKTESFFYQDHETYCRRRFNNFGL